VHPKLSWAGEICWTYHYYHCQWLPNI